MVTRRGPGGRRVVWDDGRREPWEKGGLEGGSIGKEGQKMEMNQRALCF